MLRTPTNALPPEGLWPLRQISWARHAVPLQRNLIFSLTLAFKLHLFGLFNDIFPDRVDVFILSDHMFVVASLPEFNSTTILQR